MTIIQDLKHAENVASEQTGIDRQLISSGFRNGVCLIMAEQTIIGHVKWIDDALKTMIIYTNTKNFNNERR